MVSFALRFVLLSHTYTHNLPHRHTPRTGATAGGASSSTASSERGIEGHLVKLVKCLHCESGFKGRGGKHNRLSYRWSPTCEAAGSITDFLTSQAGFYATEKADARACSSHYQSGP